MKLRIVKYTIKGGKFEYTNNVPLATFYSEIDLNTYNIISDKIHSIPSYIMSK